MNKISKMKFLSVGFLAGAIFFGGISYAATSATNIDVFFQPLKYFFDGVEKKAPDSQQGFVYNGTTYVPLRFIAESLGQKVGYQAKDFSVYVGQQPSGQVTYMEEMQTHTSDIQRVDKISAFTSNIGEKFIHGFIEASYPNGNTQYLDNLYLLNGQFKKFQAFLAPSDFWNNKPKSINLGELKIYGDDKLLYSSGAVASDITKAINVDVDLTGVLQLRVVFTNKTGTSPFEPNLGLLDAKFIN